MTVPASWSSYKESQRTQALMAWPQGQAHTARKRAVNVGHHPSSSQHLGSTYRASPSPKHWTRSPSFNLHARPQTKGPFWALCYRQGR